MADDDLERLARADLLLRALDGGEVVVAVAVGRVLRLGVGVEGRREGGYGLREVGGHRVEATHRVGVRLVDAVVGAVVVHGVRDEGDGALRVVEHREVGREHQRQLGQLQVVLGEVRDALERRTAS